MIIALEKALRLRTGREPARDRRARVCLEVLEDRATPSVFLVTNAADPRGRLKPGSLRWAITQANRPQDQGSQVEIMPGVPGTITLRAGELRIASSVTIENRSDSPVTIRQAQSNARIFHIVSGAQTSTVAIGGQDPASVLTLTGGNVRDANGGAILVDDPLNLLTLRYVDVVGNSAAQVTNPARGSKGNGGGIYTSGTLTLDHSSVSGNRARGPNSASGHAGGLYTDRGVVLVASHVDANSARNAGGILNVSGTVEITGGSTVNNNSSTGTSLPKGDLGGGGIGQMNGNVVISNSQVNGNRTVGMYSGGVVLLLGGITVTDGSQVNGNTNNGPGGGIAANFGGAVVITHGSQVKGNTGAGIGGGIVNFSENFGIDVVDHSEVSGNLLTNGEEAAGANGLALVFQNASIRKAIVGGGRGDPQLRGALELFVNACGQRVGLIDQAGSAFPSGGHIQAGAGICEVLGGPIVIEGGSSISGNRFGAVASSTNPAFGFGGGVFANLGPISIDGSTISDNVATGDAGGVWNGFSLTIRNSKITGNRAGAPGGGVFNKGTFTSTNSMIQNNVPDDIEPQRGVG